MGTSTDPDRARRRARLLRELERATFEPARVVILTTGGLQWERITKGQVVPAVARDGLAVHETPPPAFGRDQEPADYTITHINSGLIAAGPFKTERDAQVFVLRLMKLGDWRGSITDLWPLIGPDGALRAWFGGMFQRRRDRWIDPYVPGPDDPPERKKAGELS